MEGGALRCATLRFFGRSISQINMKSFLSFFSLAFILSISYCYNGQYGDETGQQNTATTSELKLVWSDEFDKDGLPDPTKWSYDVGTGCDLPCGCGWGNNEKEYYTKDRLENARAENGNLIIEARKERFEDRDYTSARLVSKGKGDWKYGRIEVKAKIPSGRGVWPAIWMLPTGNEYGGWPKSGEIDIMEHVGYLPDSIYGTVHTQAYNGMIKTQVGGNIYNPFSEKEYHNYVIEWDEEKIVWLIDDVKYFLFENEHKDFESWPFDKPFHLILNVAVGGYWGGKHGIDDDIWPRRMEIDYVRVYQ